MLTTLPAPDFIVRWITIMHEQYPFVGVLLVMMMIDVITGLIAASKGQGLSSQVSWSGMGKKVLMLLAVAMGLILEPHSGLPLGQLVAVFYTCTEGISILENMTRAGLPVPQQLRDALAQYGAKQRASSAINTGAQATVNVDIHADSASVEKTSDSVVIRSPKS